jgi:hypothetical protein
MAWSPPERSSAGYGGWPTHGLSNIQRALDDLAEPLPESGEPIDREFMSLTQSEDSLTMRRLAGRFVIMFRDV